MKLSAIAVAVVTVSMLFCGSLSAQLKYDYIEGGYAFTHLNVDEVGDGSGMSLAISWSPVKNVFLFADGNWSSVDFEGVLEDVDGDAFTGSVGLGLYQPLSDNLDIVGKAGWARREFDASVLADKIESNGVEVELGVRALLGEKLELGAFLGWADIEELADNDVEIEIGDVAFDVYGIFHLNQTCGLGLETTLQDNSSEVGAFLRLHF